MIRKTIVAIAAVLVLGAGFTLVAQEAKKSRTAEKPKAKQEVGVVKVVKESKSPAEQAGPLFQRGEGLLKELRKAYDAGDREEMGRIIQKMEQMRGKIRKVAARMRARDHIRNWAWRGHGRRAGWQRPAAGMWLRRGVQFGAGRPVISDFPMMRGAMSRGAFPGWGRMQTMGGSGMGRWAPPALGQRPMGLGQGFAPRWQGPAVGGWRDIPAGQRRPRPQQEPLSEWDW